MTESQAKLIVGFGEALVDVLPSGEVVGGAPLNFALRAAQLCGPLGWQAALISRIGADERGQKILDHLRTSSLDIAAVQVDSQRQTGFVDVTLEDGHPSYVIGPNVAWDHISLDDQVAELARRANALCFGTLVQRCPESAQTLTRLLDVADQAIKILDINLRRPYPSADVLERSLAAADVLKCNAEELSKLAQWLDIPDCDPQSEPAEIAVALQQIFNLSSVFWTRGSEGCVLQRGDHLTGGPVPELPQAPDADSVGAGDAASAALAVGLVAGWSADKIVELANYCGAFAASRRGATTPLPESFLSSLSS